MDSKGDAMDYTVAVDTQGATDGVCTLWHGGPWSACLHVYVL